MNGKNQTQRDAEEVAAALSGRWLVTYRGMRPGSRRTAVMAAPSRQAAAGEYVRIRYGYEVGENVPGIELRHFDGKRFGFRTRRVDKFDRFTLEPYDGPRQPYAYEMGLSERPVREVAF